MLYLLVTRQDGRTKNVETYESVTERYAAMRAVTVSALPGRTVYDPHTGVTTTPDGAEWELIDAPSPREDTTLDEHLRDRVYYAPDDQFVVSLLASYGPSDGVTSPQEAAEALRELASYDVQLLVTDRTTGNRHIVELD